MPEGYRSVSPADLDAWRSLSYAELAFEVLRKCCDDVPAADMKDLCAKTYTEAIFRTEAITPVKTLEPGLHILELSNGPTLAFKDMAMQLLGNLFEYVLERFGDSINILGATSGDTGSSAEYALRVLWSCSCFAAGQDEPVQTADVLAAGREHIQHRRARRVHDVRDRQAVNNDAASRRASASAR